MAEENQVQQVMTKDQKKVEVGKRLAEYNCWKAEELAQLKAQKSDSQTNLTYYGAWTCHSHWGFRLYQLLCLSIQDS